MNYDRDDYMRRQEADHDLIRMRQPVHRQRIQPDPYGCPYHGTHKPCPLCDCGRRKLGRMVDSEHVARIIEAAEIAPIIKQRLIAEVGELKVESTLARIEAALTRRSVPTMDPHYSAAFNAALDMVGRALRDSDGNPQGGDGTAPSQSDDSAGRQASPGDPQ